MANRINSDRTQVVGDQGPCYVCVLLACLGSRNALLGWRQNPRS